MSSQLPAYKADFLKAALESGALKFGTFELKSKRISPYFFNAGEFYTRKSLRALEAAYAATIAEAHANGVFDFEVVFGPAYKGIPLATLATRGLDGDKYDNIVYAFDRKEAKDHGEGGSFVGGPFRGKKVIIVDDVVTAGTAKREAIDKIRGQGGVVTGIIVALDRMEKLPSPDGDESKPMPTAIQALGREYNIPIIAILTFDDIVKGIKGIIPNSDIEKMEAYREKYKPSE
ncbi:orotate phosphoribosyltransferase protein [Echria macrotheca]|uniref:Orotate phosphoribosyltransferase n=1 Tax=Echria macrotheca TaxID=438768 RepID=A0AAJ0BCG5_9PEZI|nr:orotate phosphoribosyltransferase protein [Echria macrotheca]